MRAGQHADLAALLEDLQKPPLDRIGALKLDAFCPKKERAALAGLLASPSFESWRSGAPIDIERWLAPTAEGRTPAVIVSVAHLDDDERALVLGVLLEELLAWTRSLSGSQRLRALVLSDEVAFCRLTPPIRPPSARSCR